MRDYKEIKAAGDKNLRRAVARGRVFPQSYSTDRRYGRLSLKACALFPLLWANGDDQGRLCGDPEEVKYSCCPNIDHITKADIPGLLQELSKNDLIKVYNTSKTEAIQILDWWDVHRPQWAWPSQYPPLEGWQDHLRYKRGAKEVVTENWFSPVRQENGSGEQPVNGQVSNQIGSGETTRKPSYQHPESETERGKRKRKEEEEEGNSPETQKGTQVRSPPPSLADKPLIDYLNEVFPKAFGRNPNSRESAQLRDLGKEISSAGGATAAQVYDAFKEACELNKFSISYVRAILFDWLGIERIRAP